MSKLIFGTRPSALARWQTCKVIQDLYAIWGREDFNCLEIVIITKGDQILDKPLPEIGGKGLFTMEIERALLKERIHAAVHSLKDLPTEETEGLRIGAITRRQDARDILYCPRGCCLDTLPKDAVVGTSSVRRKAQILARRPDLRVEPIRGNVDTRIRKADQGQYDAIVLAAAGVLRLGFHDSITEYLPLETMLPAPGQGALAVQCCAADQDTLQYLSAIEHQPTRSAVIAERTFLDALGGGCSLPVGAYAKQEGETISMQVIVSTPDGQSSIRLYGESEDPLSLGLQLAQDAIEQGAQALITGAAH